MPPSARTASSTCGAAATAGERQSLLAGAFAASAGPACCCQVSAVAGFRTLTQTWPAALSDALVCRQLGLGDDKNRWVPKPLTGYTIIHPDRTLRRNRKPVLKALLLQEEPASSSSGRAGSARARTMAAL